MLWLYAPFRMEYPPPLLALDQEMPLFLLESMYVIKEMGPGAIMQTQEQEQNNLCCRGQNGKDCRMEEDQLQFQRVQLNTELQRLNPPKDSMAGSPDSRLMIDQNRVFLYASFLL